MQWAGPGGLGRARTQEDGHKGGGLMPAIDRPLSGDIMLYYLDDEVERTGDLTLSLADR